MQVFRTNERNAQVSFRSRSQPRCVRCAFSKCTRIRTKRILHAHRVPCIRHRPWTSSTAASQRPRSNRDQQQAVQGTSIGHRQNVNQTSTRRQRNVNESSTKRQRNVNGTSNRGLSRRELKTRFFGAHQRNAQRGLVDRKAVSDFHGAPIWLDRGHQQH